LPLIHPAKPSPSGWAITSLLKKEPKNGSECVEAGLRDRVKTLEALLHRELVAGREKDRMITELEGFG